MITYGSYTIKYKTNQNMGLHGRDRMVVGFITTDDFSAYHNFGVCRYKIPSNFPHLYMQLQLPMPSVPITTKVVSSNPVHGDVFSITRGSDEPVSLT